MSERKVSTDALETLGTIIDDTQKRDAIHLAVAPVRAVQRLMPGDHITIVEGRASKARNGEGHGIVDPFLEQAVRPGETFWFVMYPRKVTSLRHVWSHPDFPDEVGVERALDSRGGSWEWIARCGQEHCDGLSADELVAAAKEYVNYGEYLVHGPRFEGTYLPDEFWPHFENVTGTKVEESKRGSFFSCSC